MTIVREREREQIEVEQTSHFSRLHPARGILRSNEWKRRMGMIYREREVNMRAQNDLRSSRIGSFSRRRGLGHSREAFSRGRRQGGVMKVSRCIAFGTKPAVVQCIPSCCVTLCSFHSHQADTHTSNHTKVLNSASLWRNLQKFDVDKSTPKTF